MEACTTTATSRGIGAGVGCWPRSATKMSRTKANGSKWMSSGAAPWSMLWTTCCQPDPCEMAYWRDRRRAPRSRWRGTSRLSSREVSASASSLSYLQQGSAIPRDPHGRVTDGRRPSSGLTTLLSMISASCGNSRTFADQSHQCIHQMISAGRRRSALENRAARLPPSSSTAKLYQWRLV